MKHKWICPYLDIRYSLPCPIKSCHSHCGNRHASGCMHNVTKGSLTIEDIAYIKRKPRTVIEKRYERGLRRLRDLVELDKFLDNVREQRYFSCPKCGVLSVTPIHCAEDDIECLNRQYLSRLMLRLYPLNIPPFEATQSDVWRLVKNSKHFDQKRERKLYDILHLSKSLRRRLNAVNPVLNPVA